MLWDERKLFAQGFDFGFMKESVYTRLQSIWRVPGNYHFVGGSTVDFTLRSKGADGIFGSADDDYFRLSDAADFVDQFYFGPPLIPRGHAIQLLTKPITANSS